VQGMMGRRKQCARGFTLIEIMVALTVMGFAVVFLVQLFSSNLRTIGTSQDYMTALTRAESIMREIVESDKLEEKSWRDLTDQGYQVEVTVSETQKERTEQLPIKLLQIELVFSWERALRKKSMTLRTLKVVNKIDNRSAVEQKL
jgi:prepilin-type N-terminal cleavage/methylation domain-containing protein